MRPITATRRSRRKNWCLISHCQSSSPREETAQHFLLSSVVCDKDYKAKTMTLFGFEEESDKEFGGTSLALFLLFCMTLPFLFAWWTPPIVPATNSPKHPVADRVVPPPPPVAVKDEGTSGTMKRPTESGKSLDDNRDQNVKVGNLEKDSAAKSLETPLIGGMEKEEEPQWRCVCETSFLPKNMLNSLGGVEAAFRMSTGQCYHKRN
jgi:hypothetical protein